MHLKLRDQQLNTVMCIYRWLYQNLTVTANRKSIIDIHTQREKGSKHKTKESQITREQKRKGRNKTYKNRLKTVNKMALRSYILIITLNVNR